MAYERDPVSVLFDTGARVLLRRAYARPGVYVGTRIVFPSARQVAHFGGQGINVLGRDQWGRPRWAAAFVRACHHQHKWHYAQGRFQEERRMTPNNSPPISVEIGRRVPVLGVIPAGQSVRVIAHADGQDPGKVVRRLPDSKRIVGDDGEKGGRYANPEERDW
jgi:hypothetical protein